MPVLHEQRRGADENGADLAGGKALPGIADGFQINTAITLPVGVEAYGAYALRAWLAPGVVESARRFARCSAIGSLALGMLGQVVYHLLSAAHATRAPWPVVVLVSCLPVVTLGFGTALTHLLRDDVAEDMPDGVSIPALDEATGTVADAPVAVPRTAPIPALTEAAWTVANVFETPPIVLNPWLIRSIAKPSARTSPT